MLYLTNYIISTLTCDNVKSSFVVNGCCGAAGSTPVPTECASLTSLEASVASVSPQLKVSGTMSMGEWVDAFCSNRPSNPENGFCAGSAPHCTAAGMAQAASYGVAGAAAASSAVQAEVDALKVQGDTRDWEMGTYDQLAQLFVGEDYTYPEFFPLSDPTLPPCNDLNSLIVDQMKQLNMYNYQDMNNNFSAVSSNDPDSYINTFAIFGGSSAGSTPPPIDPTQNAYYLFYKKDGVPDGVHPVSPWAGSYVDISQNLPAGKSRLAWGHMTQNPYKSSKPFAIDPQSTYSTKAGYAHEYPIVNSVYKEGKVLSASMQWVNAPSGVVGTHLFRAPLMGRINLPFGNIGTADNIAASHVNANGMIIPGSFRQVTRNTDMFGAVSNEQLSRFLTCPFRDSSGLDQITRFMWDTSFALL